MSELSILQAFVKSGMTPIGACALGGNIQAEGVWRSNNAQDAYEQTRGFTDASYTAAVNDRSYTRDQFCKDGVGYGLCQWTEKSRKAKLYDFAQARGAKIDDEAMQTKFAIFELQSDYPNLWRYLCQTQDLSGATGRICTEYERPAVKNTSTRTMYANNLFMRYADKLNALDATGDALETVCTDVQDKNWVGEKDPCECEEQCIGKLMPTIKNGNKSPEARYLADKLAALGYNVLWSGLWSCLVDYQQKRGLTVDGICGEQTWMSLMKEKT